MEKELDIWWLWRPSLCINNQQQHRRDVCLPAHQPPAHTAWRRRAEVAAGRWTESWCWEKVCKETFSFWVSAELFQLMILLSVCWVRVDYEIFSFKPVWPIKTFDYPSSIQIGCERNIFIEKLGITRYFKMYIKRHWWKHSSSLSSWCTEVISWSLFL